MLYWRQNSFFAYKCALIKMGETLDIILDPCSMNVEYLDPSGSNHVNQQEARECFIAFLELAREDISNHGFYLAVNNPFEISGWRESERHIDDILIEFEDCVDDWKKRAIESAIQHITFEDLKYPPSVLLPPPENEAILLEAFMEDVNNLQAYFNNPHILGI